MINHLSIIKDSAAYVRITLSSVLLLLLVVSCSDTDPNTQQTAAFASLAESPASTVPEKDERFAMSEDRAARKANQVLDTLTAEEKIGQLFFIAADGRFMHEDDERYIALSETIRREHVGGLLFFKGSVYPQAQLTNRLQQINPIPLWVTQDMEFGAAMRVRGTTTLPPAMGIAATRNPDYARQSGYITAKEARSLGVHQIFAPVVDVNNNPDNPVINVRSFGGTPELVARFGDAFIEGVKKTGVLSTAKHFPGHGDTHIDSHLRLPTIRSDYDQLRSLELVPFISAINAGVESIMSAHISFPRIGDNKRTPATMDPVLLDHILRDSLNFNGLVVTDALEMHGITNHYSPGEAALKAIRAGSDILLISPDATAAIHHIAKALREGKVAEERIDRSVRKLLTWKFRKGLFENARVSISQLSEQINPPAYESAARNIARESITLLSNRLDIVPVHAEKYESICAVALADDRSGETGTRMARVMRRYHPNVSFYTYDERSGAEEKRRIRRCARQADLLVIGSYIYVKTYQDINLTREQKRFIESLSSYSNPEILISFGNPYIFKDIPHAEVDMQAWAPFDIQVDAAVEALFGAAPIGGKMPIRFPPHFGRGDGLQMPQQSPVLAVGKSPEVPGHLSRTLINKFGRAIRDSLFPGAILSIMENGRLIYNNSFGYETFDKNEQLTAITTYPFEGIAFQFPGALDPAMLQSLEMRKTKIEDPESDDQKEKSRLHTTTFDLSRLIFTLTNEGKYKNRQAIPDTSINRYIERLPVDRMGSTSYKKIGGRHSNIWMNPKSKRSIMLLIPATGEFRFSAESNQLREFRKSLLQEIQQALEQRPMKLWTRDSNSKPRS